MLRMPSGKKLETNSVREDTLLPNKGLQASF